MISGFVNPWEPWFMDSDIPNSFNEDKTIDGNIVEIWFVAILSLGKQQIELLENIWKRPAPEHDEAPFKKIFMGQMLIEKHEVDIW